ncbi:GNAT family N-acetyltransferase [Herbiconiux sp. 11R-BC]|uniref:GNAT family N-acetyltransferase n=1 Tax=Herbiconiux sp. 11R-BC TaxID=3111637 RepID=UPI003BFEEFE0
MIIRAGASDERDACVAVWLEALRARDEQDQGPEVATRAHAKFDRPLVRFAVAVAGARDDPTAFALTEGAGIRSGERIAMLELLAVAPSDAGRGVGRALVVDAIDAAARLGCSTLELQVRAGNSRAEKLYSSLGFTPQGEPAPHPLGGPPMVAYARPLSPISA